MYTNTHTCTTRTNKQTRIYTNYNTYTHAHVARALGIGRLSRASDARTAHPNLVLVHVRVVGPTRAKYDSDMTRTHTLSDRLAVERKYSDMFARGRHGNKSCLQRYRSKSMSVMRIMQRFCDQVERASVDEAYLDLSKVAHARLLTNSDTRRRSERSDAESRSRSESESGNTSESGSESGTCTREPERDTKQSIDAVKERGWNDVARLVSDATHPDGTEHNRLLYAAAEVLRRQEGWRGMIQWIRCCHVILAVETFHVILVCACLSMCVRCEEEKENEGGVRRGEARRGE
jgi:impB/mucB/samB family